jgi:hypothetical protein
VDDLRLRLIAEVWDADGQLDWFCAWLWTTGMLDLGQRLGELTGYQDDGAPVHVDDRWLRAALGSASAFGGRTPCTGGTDPLHLSVHCTGPLADPEGAPPTLLRSSVREGRAVLLLDSMVGWYRALIEGGESLPDLQGRSWHVDVVVRPVGLLGTYRRSRASGLWFAGRHRFHLRGI